MAATLFALVLCYFTAIQASPIGIQTLPAVIDSDSTGAAVLPAEVESDSGVSAGVLPVVPESGIGAGVLPIIPEDSGISAGVLPGEPSSPAVLPAEEESSSDSNDAVVLRLNIRVPIGVSSASGSSPAAPSPINPSDLLRPEEDQVIVLPVQDIAPIYDNEVDYDRPNEWIR